MKAGEVRRGRRGAKCGGNGCRRGHQSGNEIFMEASRRRGSGDEQDGSPELGSQGSMSSSSLGHSADATSRSSADCGEKTKTAVRRKDALFCCCHFVVVAVIVFFFYCL